MILRNTRIQAYLIMNYNRYPVLSEAERNIVVQIEEDTVNFS